MALNKAWRDKVGSGTQYEADSTAPSDNTPVDAAGMRDLESRAAAAITAAVAAEATARATNDTALNAAFAAGLAGRAPLSSNVGDTGKAIDAHTGAPLALPAQSGSGAVLVQQSEPEDVAINTLWVEIDDADPPNVIAIHVAVA